MTHPYRHLPDRNFWNKSVSNTPWGQIALKESGKFTINKSDKVATAGSCFAQRIVQYLRESGYTHFNAEAPHPLIPEAMARELNYFQYSARYGNIYTTRQLRELGEQALGSRDPIIDYAEQDGFFFDLLRPSIQKNGFHSIEELTADRFFHLSRVKRMLEEADVFIFTLGLTEAWISTREKHVYPVCPASAIAGVSEGLAQAVNFGFVEVYRDLKYFFDSLFAVNPKVRVVLTVSPVALAATHQDMHVLSATVYSKSVLRAVAGECCAEFPNVDYFPSYELIASAASYGQYLSPDLREVNQRGVAHVMRSFSHAFLPNRHGTGNSLPALACDRAESMTAALTSAALASAECDELVHALPAQAGSNRASVPPAGGKQISAPRFRDHFDFAASVVEAWLRPEIDLQNAALLDFGCGDGITDLGVALKCRPRCMTGVDITSGYLYLADAAENQQA